MEEFTYIYLGGHLAEVVCGHSAFVFFFMYIPMTSPMPQYFSRFGQCEFQDLAGEELDISNLHAHVIESPAREILLSSHRRFNFGQSEAGIDALTLLSDLSRLAPSVAKDFVPKHFAENSVPFRLLNDIYSQCEPKGYIALSYCRKRVEADTPRRVVTPIAFGWSKEEDQFPIPTSNAIFQAVLREKRPEEGLWYDQVCINQDDETERVASMGAIDTIYQNARTVVVALDDVAATPDEEQFLRYYVERYAYSELPNDQQPNTGMSPPVMHQYPLLWSFLERVLSSAWFGRAWCAHEMRSGQNHVFVLPCYSPYGGQVSTVIRFTGAFFLHLLVLANEIYPATPAYHGKLRSLHEFFHQRITLNGDTFLAMQRPDTPQMSNSDGVALIPKIAETFKLQASGNPRLSPHLRQQDANRDKMGIALNASGLPLAMTSANTLSRPNIEDECLRSLLLVGLAARDPVALCTTGTPLRLHDGSTSWLSRPTPLDISSIRPAPPRFSRRATPIAQGSDGRAEYAQLDLVFLDLPHRTNPNPSFSSQVVRARTLIDLCIQYQLDGGALWNSWQAQGHPRALTMRNTFIQTLACVFECGPQWLLELSSRLKTYDTLTLEPHTIEMMLNPHLILQNYIILPEGQAALSSLLAFLSTLITSGIPWASGASEYNYGPLMINGPGSSSSDQDASVLTPTYGGKAIIFAPFEHSKTLLIAVPAAVKDSHYDTLARGWVLTSMNPYTGSAKRTVSWTLQSKAVLFGDTIFTTSLECSGNSDVRNHCVYGP
jgi:hypothetical protein